MFESLYSKVKLKVIILPWKCWGPAWCWCCRVSNSCCNRWSWSCLLLLPSVLRLPGSVLSSTPAPCTAGPNLPPPESSSPAWPGPPSSMIRSPAPDMLDIPLPPCRPPARGMPGPGRYPLATAGSALRWRSSLCRYVSLSINRYIILQYIKLRVILEAVSFFLIKMLFEDEYFLLKN